MNSQTTRTSLADLQKAAEAGARAATALLPPRPTDRGAVQAFGTRMTSYLRRRKSRRAATPAPEPTSPLTKMLLEYEARLNVFCPTGDGGGIDPTCSPGGGGKGTPRGLVGRSVEQLPVSSISLGSKRAEVELEFDYSKGVRSTNPRKPILVDENNEVIDGAHRLVEARKRGEDTISAIRVTRAEHEALGDEALGIRPKGTEDIRKGKEFDEWMDKHYYMVGNVFCPTGPGGGVDPTCSPSEKLARLPEAGPNYFATMGLVRAWLRTPVANSPPPRKALADALYDISSEYTRAQAREVARAIREGYDNDKGVEKVASELKRRLGLEDAQANVLAQTEMTRVAALDQLDQTARAGLDEVMFISHENACPQCEALHGKTFPLKRAHDVLPVHPNCKCRFQPVESTHNVFCPTGEGGGVDPTCSPGAKGVSGGVKTVDDLRGELTVDPNTGRLGTRDLINVEVKAYRVGSTVDKHGRGVYLSGDREGAEQYAGLHQGEQVKGYTVRLKKVLLAGHQNDVTRKLFNKPYGEFYSGGVEGGRKADVKVARKLKQLGYDGLILLKPAPPATSEVAVFTAGALTPDSKSE